MTDTRKLTKMALLLALLCISAYISFPLPFTPVMITALTFVMCLIALMLTPKETFILLCVYILLGAIGLPVFVGGKSGIAPLFGPTGGFIWGWPVAYTLLSIFKGKSKTFCSYLWRSIVITIPMTYLFGVTGLMIVAKFGFMQAIMAAALPFIPGDILKAALASYLATKVKLAH